MVADIMLIAFFKMYVSRCHFFWVQIWLDSWHCYLTQSDVEHIRCSKYITDRTLGIIQIQKWESLTPHLGKLSSRKSNETWELVQSGDAPPPSGVGTFLNLGLFWIFFMFGIFYFSFMLSTVHAGTFIFNLLF